MADEAPKEDALTRAAELWGTARVSYRKDHATPWTTRMVSTMRCARCSKRIAWARYKDHVLAHFRE